MFTKLIFISILCHFGHCQEYCRGFPVEESGVSDEEIQEILDVHNGYRLQIANGQVPGQPKASNMKKMEWDDNLAYEAQNIADLCYFEHKEVNDDRFFVGQNLYTWMTTQFTPKASWTSGIEEWFEEVRTYTFGTTEYNHYTQVVWANTTLVGCGYTHFQNDKGWYQKLYVCNYGPAGNYIDQEPYEVGDGCENLC